MEVLLGIIAALIGGVIWQSKKRRIAEARNENIDIKEKINEISKGISKNEGSIQAEADKQSSLQKEIDNNAKKDNSLSTIIDILKRL